MLRETILLCCATALSNGSNAQNLFLEVHGANLLPLGRAQYSYDFPVSTTSGTTYYWSSVLSNYGKGAGGGLVFGGSFTEHLGWELRGTYVAGRPGTLECNSTGPSGSSSETLERAGRYVKVEPAMRVGPIGFAGLALKDVLAEALRSAAVTHDHPEGIKGAQATAAAIFLARQGSTKKN